MKRKLPFCVLMANLIFLTTTHAQLFKIELSEKAKASSVIAEGKVIAQKSFWNDAHTMIFTANTVEVYKMFKGQITTSTIEVMTQGGSVGTRAVEVSDLLTLNKGQTGIFFCYENTAGIKSPSRQPLYDVYSSDQGFLRYNYANNTASAPFASYSDIENNLYSLIEQQTGQSKKITNTSFSVGKMLKASATISSNGVEGTLSPVITSFSPTTVNAGTLNDPDKSSLLTIKGSGFGSPTGQASINFTDGNTDNSPPDYVVDYTSPYIVSWTDTQIRLNVPTRAATGNFTVVTSDGTSVTSLTKLVVNFSVLNFLFNFSSLGIDTIVAEEPRLMNTNGAGGYTYMFSNNTAGKGINFAADPATGTFNRAVTTWKEIVGANLKAGGNTTKQAVGDDSINVVMYDNLNTGVPPMGAGVLEVTYSFGSTCFTQTPFSVLTAQKSGFDILIRNPGVSLGDTVQFNPGPCPISFYNLNDTFDLENIILHEIGHALNLAHINDDYEVTNGAYSHVNPSKVMHYSVLPFVDRHSPDNAAYTGALYTVTPQENDFGNCGLYPGSMAQLPHTVIPNDECPGAFPTAGTTIGTVVNFDLVHATSNKHKDPAFTQVNGLNNGAPVTNNAYYALKITNSGILTLSVSNYTTTPGEIANCAGQGVRMALYKVNACPVGDSFPPPVATATFAGNGALSSITGLTPNTTYLLYFDGLRNTKANFNLTLGGSALPIVLANFTGEYIHGVDNLYVDITQAINVKNIAIERSDDGNIFSQLGLLPVPSAQLVGKHTYTDAQPFVGKNYYRLKITDNDGMYQYSNIIVLQNTLNQKTYVYPNPAKNNAYISFSGIQAGRYSCVVYDASGKAIISREYTLAIGNQTVSVPLNNMAGGIYVVRVTDSKGKTVTLQKLVKE